MLAPAVPPRFPAQPCGYTGLFSAVTGAPGRTYSHEVRSAQRLEGDIQRPVGTVSQHDDGSLYPGGVRLLLPFLAVSNIQIDYSIVQHGRFVKLPALSASLEVPGSFFPRQAGNDRGRGEYVNWRLHSAPRKAGWHMSDMRDRIKGDENAFQKLAEAIPGFDGYREQEIRRTADRLVRDHLVKLLDAIRGKLEGLMRESGTSDIELTSKIGRTQRRMTTLRDRIDHASYGYTGFFDAIKIEEEELDRMYDYDMSLMKHIADMDATVAELAAADSADYDDLLAELEAQMDYLEQMLDDRDEVISSAVPGDAISKQVSV